MKDAHLEDYLLWKGKPAKIIGISDKRMVIIEMIENSRCPHCNGELEKEQIHAVVASPLFQQNAERISTIEDDPSLFVS